MAGAWCKSPFAGRRGASILARAQAADGSVFFFALFWKPPDASRRLTLRRSIMRRSVQGIFWWSAPASRAAESTC